MILSRVNDYLRQHKRASLVDLAHGLDAAPDALQGMLATLERKGRVRRLPTGTSCSGCCKCDPYAVELYEWTGD
jgi:Mn-dependent DtxR family transcriptional regulator